jgi:hypothetical protein
MMFQEPFSWKSLYFSFGEEYPVRLVIVTYWFFVLAATASGAAIWFRWRFSLRSLLIGTALLALVLVWVMSHF